MDIIAPQQQSLLTAAPLIIVGIPVTICRPPSQSISSKQKSSRVVHRNIDVDVKIACESIPSDSKYFEFC
jgi:hypothetical protein